MIVSHELKAVFLHIPKTGGSSIAKALSINTKEFIVGRGKHQIIPSKIPKNYFIFSFVRNPWDRMLSYYMFRTKEHRTRRRKTVHPLERKSNFTEWLLLLDYFARWKKINPAFEIAIAPQCDTLSNIPDFIGRFETINVDFDYVCSQIGIDAPRLTNKNPTVSKTKHYSHFYDREAKHLVGHRFSKDVQTYGYSFDLENMSEFGENK